MANILRNTFVPLLGLFVLIIGTTYFSTYVSLRLNDSGTSNWLIGLIFSAQSGGFLFGALIIEKVIRRTGHIRAFTVFAACLSSIMLLHAIYIDPYVWAFQRFIGGVCLAGIYVVVESWLLVLSDSKSRGRVLSLYMVSLYGAQTLSQGFVNIEDFQALEPFIWAAIACSFAVIPVALKKVDCPQFEHSSLMSLKSVFRISPLGFVACFLSGLFIAPTYSLLPVFVQDIGLESHQVATAMFSTLLGGMILQWPVGILSDNIPRPKVLGYLMILQLVLSAVVWMLIAYLSPVHLFFLLFIFGGVVFSIYPIGVSIATDYFQPQDLVAGTGVLLLSYSVGSILGPLVVPFFMNFSRLTGFFQYVFLLSAVFVAYSFYRRIVRPPLPVEEQVGFVPVPQTSIHVAELDPRSPDENVDGSEQ